MLHPEYHMTKGMQVAERVCGRVCAGEVWGVFFLLVRLLSGLPMNNHSCLKCHLPNSVAPSGSLCRGLCWLTGVVFFFVFV